MLPIDEHARFKPRTIRYYGGKAKLADFIIKGMSEFGLREGMRVLDGFTGTSVIAQELKYRGYQTFANDNLYFSYALADAHLAFNELPKFENLNLEPEIFVYLNTIKPSTGFVTKNYSPYDDCDRMYLSVENAQKVDAIRDQIEVWKSKNLITLSEFLSVVA
jgi:adenine-specific DNA-methyltransferase